MLVYFLGIPGSGKTYYSVNVIYDNFVNDSSKHSKLSLKKDYDNCYTNINEFNFERTNNVFKLDFDEFKEKITILYNMALGKSDSIIELPEDDNLKDEFVVPSYGELLKSGMPRDKAQKYLEDLRNKSVQKDISKKQILKKASDEELIAKAKELNIYKTLFIIDEAHNYFAENDKILVWWLTYHRHLYHDIYLITQNLSLIDSKYKPLAEAFYRAKPMSLILNHNYFKYNYYIDSRMTKSSFVNTISIKRNQEVFKLYHSGDSVKSTNVILRYVYITIGLLVLFLIAAYFVYGNLTSFRKKSPTSLSHTSSVVVNSAAKSLKENHVYSSVSSSSDEDYSQKIFIAFNCSLSVCSSSDNFSIPPQLLNKFEEMKLIHSYYKEKISKSLVIDYVSMDTDFKTFLYSNVKDNINENSSNSAFTMFNSPSK